MRKALALALTIMVLLTFVVSPVAAGMFDRKATWEKYKYRCGDGNMGWLRTPDFKNGGFETGNSAYWYSSPIGFNVFKETSLAAPNGGMYLGWWYLSRPSSYAGEMYISQYVRANTATGVSAYIKVKNLDLDGKTATFTIYADDDVIYTENLSADFDWKQVYSDSFSYRGMKTFKLCYAIEDGVSGNFYYDDIHLVGPGF